MASFLSAVVVQMLEQIDHRTLEVIIFLGSWSPIYGMREDTRLYEAVAVALGAFIALLMRLLISAVAEPGPNSNYVNFSMLSAPLMLWFLALKAAINYRSANEYRAQVALKSHTELPPPSGGASAVAELEVSPTQPLQGPWERGPVIAGFFVTLVCMFVVAADVQLQGQSRAGDSIGERVGSVFGLLAAASLAVLVGTMLEHVLSDRRFLLATSVVMGLTAMTATSSAILHFFFFPEPKAVPA